jgi:hypothetical protein
MGTGVISADVPRLRTKTALAIAFLAGFDLISRDIGEALCIDTGCQLQSRGEQIGLSAECRSDIRFRGYPCELGK